MLRADRALGSADDLGSNEMGFMNSTRGLHTPNLDQLAFGGVTLRNCESEASSAALCYCERSVRAPPLTSLGQTTSSRSARRPARP